MEFRPCIDIHNGKVKQIVGGSLTDEKNVAQENFVSKQEAAFYANLYRKNNLTGGHVILLNPSESNFYAKTKQQALSALKAYPGGLQIGGGITDENAKDYLQAGASHVIITSFVFHDGDVRYHNLEKMNDLIGKDKLVLDLSCRLKGGRYYIVTDRWQKYTNVELNRTALDLFKDYCGEFLIHAVDVEGKAGGIEEELVSMLGEWGKLPITYAGGVHKIEDLDKLKKLGRDKIDVTIGSALDLFGGEMKWEETLDYFRKFGTKKEPI